MAFNDILTGFRLHSTDPIDSRLVVSDLITRNAIPVASRYEGLQTYVISEKEIFILQDGVEDSNWVDITSAISEEFLTEYETKEQLVAKLGDAYLTIHETAAEIQAKLNGLFVPGGSVEAETLSHFVYDPITNKLVADRAIETTLNSLFLGEQHKMSSGSENIFFTNLTSDINFFPMWGGLKDQSLTVNQGASGFIPPSGRVYSDMFSLPLRGNPNPLTAVPYGGDNYFGINITGLGITTVAAEEVASTIRLEYRIEISGRNVYKQILPRAATRSSASNHIYAGDVIEWFFDHPVDVRAGTTLYAEIMKVDIATDTDLGIFLVREGDATNPDGSFQYQSTVHNRLFEDKDLELISPYTKYKAMDFGLDSTGSTIFLRDLSLGTDNLLVPYAVNTLEAVANGTEIRIKVKSGAKIIVESLPVNAASIDGSFVNSVLNQAVVQLNALFTNTSGFTGGGGGGGSDTFVDSFTLSGDNLTLGLSDGVSYTVDVTTLGVDENKFVTNAALSGNIVTFTMNDATSVFLDATALNIDNDTIITSGSVSGNTLNLTTNDGSIIAIDVTTLSVDTDISVASGSVVGSDLVLVLSDASTVTIDASNMINGSTGLAVNANWFVSYGTDANTAVNNPQTNLAAGVAANAPFYFGTSLTRGSEMKWNHTLVNKQAVFGIWAGVEATAGTFNSRVHAYNWSTAFKWLGQGFVDFNTNMDLITANNTAAAYTPIQGSEMKLRFGNDGHLSLINIVSGAEVLVMKTTIPLSVTEFKLQMGSDQNQNFPQAQVVDIESLWEIVHDFNNTEGGIDNGILDHTILKSGVSIELGEKIMFMLDEVGQGDFFGTDYNNASTGISTAEEQLDNQFKYQTNEALVFTQGGANDWDMNTNASGYFFAANLEQYREGGGSGTVQGMFSLRFNNDGKLTIYDEDAGIEVATAKMNPVVGSSVHLYFGVRGNRAYYTIPVISKQSLSQANQPNANFIPTVADQTVTVIDGEVLNFQVISSNNIVNQFVESDAPSWMVMNQNSGVLSGTASGGAATHVVNCKAGNAIGGTVDFTVTVTVDAAAATYSNTKSLQFDGSSSWLQGNATLMNAMDRVTNGDGNAWTLSMWVKPSSTTTSQCLFSYGSGSAATYGAITLNQGNDSLVLNYGANSNVIALAALNVLTIGSWNHVAVVFDGGTTGANVADLSDYYSRFSIYVDGVATTVYGSHANNGYDGYLNGNDVSDNIFRIGRASNIYNNYCDGIINQVGIWNSDESSNIASIYNSGTTQDLSLLTSAPSHYYEIGTSATTVSDLTGNAHFTGYNFAASDIVTDVP